MPRTGIVLRVALVLLALGSVASRGSASSGFSEPPAPGTYVSRNGRFAVTIVSEAPESGPDGSQEPAPDRLGPGDRGRAYFYTVDRHGTPTLAGRFDLVGEAVPADALVSEDGRFLVTFGSGDPVGGGHAVVLYRTDGALVRALSLRDILTAPDIHALSTGWPRGPWREGHFIDESGTLLVLRISRCADGGCLDEPPQIAVHLEDGTPLRPAWDLLPRIQPAALLGPGEAPGDRGRPFHPDDPRCPDVAAFESAPEVSFERLQATADFAPPSYSVVAAKARLSGTVLLELLVENGAVVCLQTVKDLPMGLGRAAREAALAWQFPPAPEGESFRTVVKLQFDFHVVRPAPMQEPE